MKIYDITLPIDDGMTVWPGDPAVEVEQICHLDKGDSSTVTRIAMAVHSGTHIDAPGHFIPGGRSVDQIDLQLLIGPARLVDVGDAPAVTAEVLDSLDIPAGTERLLLKTRNSALWARGEKRFDESYVGVREDGAQWLVERGVRLVGIDYLSIAPFADTGPSHRILLEAQVVPVEGLALHEVPPGEYTLTCLPMKIAGSDGAPVRALLTT
jgi:arylformamidase